MADFTSMTLTQLRAECTGRSRGVSGTKTVSIARLNDYEGSTSASAPKATGKKAAQSNPKKRKAEEITPAADMDEKEASIKGLFGYKTNAKPSNSSTDVYRTTLNCETAAIRLELKPINGQTWSLGANYRVDALSNDGKVTIYPRFATTSGKYTYIRNVVSTQLKNMRNLVIYTPSSYYENPLRPWYPTLVMHDGQNLFNASTSFGGQAWFCQDTIDSLTLEGAMEEIIVIGVDNTPDRIAELTYSKDAGYGGGKGDLYLDFIYDTVLPLVKESYRISTERGQLGILGSSLGGLISCYAGWTRSSVYSRVGCMSSSFWWNKQDFDKVIMQNPKPSQRTTFYLDSGDASNGGGDDGSIETKTVLAHFQRLGYTLTDDLFYYLDKGAQHSEYFWGRRFHMPMKALFPVIPIKPTT